MPRLTMAPAMAMVAITARGPPTPRLTMEATDTEDSAMAMARGQLTPRLTMVATDMADTDMERGLPMPTMAGTDTEVMAMARGLLMLRLTMEATDTEVLATAMARG